MKAREFKEASGALTDHWYAAAQKHQVTGDKPIQRIIFGEMIVLFRDKDGKPVALTDRCLHRNALLSEGTMIDHCLKCPYHGWTFDRAGECVNIPSEGEHGMAARERKLQTYHCTDSDGLVWVWMGSGEPTEKPFAMPHYDEPGYGAYYMETMFPNGVTQLVENFMDVPHTVFVHKGWFRSRKAQRVKTIVERTADSVLVTYDQPKDTIGFAERILNPKKLPMVHTDKFYMPNNTRVDYIYGKNDRAFVITSTCTPSAPYLTRVFTLISYKLGMLNPLARLFLPFYTRQVIEQDVDIMTIQGRALEHHGDEKFSSTPADTMHLYIESLRRFEEKNKHGEKPKPIVKELEFWI